MSHKELLRQNFYSNLIDELQNGIGQLVKEYREAAMKVMWWVGKRIEEDTSKFKEAGIEEESIARIIAKDVGKSRAWVYHSINIYKKFPTFEKIYELPEGENISLHKLIKDHIYDKREGAPREQEICPTCKRPL